MKNNYKNFTSKYIFAIAIFIFFNLTDLSAGKLFESNNQQTIVNSTGQQSNNRTSNDDLWGSSKSDLFEKSSSGIQANAPVLPDEPGATCVPVPDGIHIILSIAFLYSLVVLYLSKRKTNMEK